MTKAAVVRRFAGALLGVPIFTIPAFAQAETAPAVPILTGEAAYGDWTKDTPGVRRHFTLADIPPPYASEVKPNYSTLVAPPEGAVPKVPAGFTVQPFAQMKKPRAIHVAPNGDIFVAETAAGEIHLLRAADGAAKPSQSEVFASGLSGPFGIAFYPAGADPQYIYIANQTSVIRYAYRNGDLKAAGPAETIVPSLPTGGGHATHEIMFSPDGTKLYIVVGSRSNDAETMEKPTPGTIRTAETAGGMGASWGEETGRATVLTTSPDGKTGLKSFINGIRNCSGLAVQPQTGDVWCTATERDLLGDNMPPDFVTRVKQGQFYGWPWFYIGDHPDPHHKDERADLTNKITVPDVLIQPHSAPLGIAFYTGGQFPADYKGDAFVTLHGSFNRANRTGYKVVRIILKDGKPTGEYDDFLTGLVTADGQVWGRPVGVAVAHDGALLVGEDGNSMIWRVSYDGGKGR